MQYISVAEVLYHWLRNHCTKALAGEGIRVPYSHHASSFKIIIYEVKFEEEKVETKRTKFHLTYLKLILLLFRFRSFEISFCWSLICLCLYKFGGWSSTSLRSVLRSLLYIIHLFKILLEVSLFWLEDGYV